MKSRNFAHLIVSDLRSRRMSPATILEFARCAALVHVGDHFDFERYGKKLLHRHRNRPGPRIDLERKQRIADAALMARFNAPSIGKDEAARKAADAYGLRQSEVFEAAFKYKRKAMRALIRRTARRNKGGSQK